MVKSIIGRSNIFGWLSIVLLLCNMATAQTNVKPLQYTGVTLAGGEFYSPKIGVRPVYGTNFIYPTADEIDYFSAHGMNIFRVAFRWETLQAKAGAPFDKTELNRLVTIIHQITSKHHIAILDPHNYARYYDQVIGGPAVSAADFADFWRQLAIAFADDDRVWFGLMNEPHDMPAEQWLTAANAAIAAIRNAGAKNEVLVPGIAWSGAHSWISSGNAVTMLKITDPANRCMFEVHQYLDADSSGTTPNVVSPTIGVERLKSFTDWCRTNHYKAFLGELAAADSPEGKVAIENMLTAMEASPDVWTGYAWWAAGSWWHEYMFTLHPTADQHDRAQLAWLKPHLQNVNHKSANKNF